MWRLLVRVAYSIIYVPNVYILHKLFGEIVGVIASDDCVKEALVDSSDV
jgi:hypothetical protein